MDKKLVLGINTTVYPSQIALYGEDMEREIAVLEEGQDMEAMIKNIVTIFKDQKYSLQDIDSLFVVNGPGPFTSVRVAVVIANTLAYSLGVPIYSINGFQYMSFVNEKIKYFGLYAGKKEICLWDKAKDSQTFYTLENFEKWEKKNKKKIIMGFNNRIECIVKASGNIENKPISMLDVMKAYFMSHAKTPETQIVPHYFRPPDITVPKKS